MRKKTGFSIFICFLFGIFLFAGCGQKEEPAEQNDNEVYVAEYRIFQMGESSPYSSVFNEDGSVYFAGSGKGINGQLFLLEAGQKEPKEIDLGISEETWISSMGHDRNGNLLLACSRYEDRLEGLELKKVSSDGSILQSLDVTGIFMDIPGFEADCLTGDVRGNYYISDKKKLYIVSAEGTLLQALEMEASIEDILPVKEENRLLARLSNGTMAEINEENFMVKSLDGKIEFRQGIYTSGQETELLYTQGDTLYACDVKDETPDKLLNWTDCDVNSATLQSFIMLGDGRIAAFSAQYNLQGECEVALLTKTPKEDIAEKTVITYGCVYPSSLLCSQVVRFNKLNQQYRIELMQYGEDGMDLGEIKDIIRMDILAGNAPDIIDIGVGFSEEERCELIEAGVFEDLAPYMEKETKIGREDFLEGPLLVYERNPALYAIMPTFGLYGLVAKESEIGDRTVVNLEELALLYNDYYGDAKLLPGFSRKKMLDVLCQLNIDSFVDKETGECHFEDESFMQILEFAARFGEEDKQAEIEQIRNGEILFMEAALLSAADVQYYEFLFGDSVRMIGYPADADSGLMALPCVSVLSMNKQTGNKEGAWQFICFLLEEEQQKELGLSGAQGIPINKKVIDMLCEKQMEVEYEMDEEGNLQERSKVSWKIGDITVKYYAVTEEEADYYKELLGQIGNTGDAGMQQGLLAIVQEEASDYFEGMKPIEEVCEIIQSRAQNYVNEKFDIPE